MKKVVITGGACCGKTSLITEFDKRGFPVLEEVARSVLEERKDYTPTHEEWIVRERTMYHRQLELEAKLSGEIAFLDRGLIDYIAYAGHLIGSIPDFMDVKMAKYDYVFALDRIPFVNDGLRIESGDSDAQKIHNIVVDAYSSNGYSIINVPLMPISARADYILSHMNNVNTK